MKNVVIIYFCSFSINTQNISVGNSAAMANIFGETHTNAAARVEKVHAVRKGTITSGRIGDYVTEIVQSYALGYTSYHISWRNNLKPVRTFSTSGEVYDYDDNVTDLVLNESTGGKKSSYL